MYFFVAAKKFLLLILILRLSIANFQRKGGSGNGQRLAASAALFGQLDTGMLCCFHIDTPRCFVTENIRMGCCRNPGKIWPGVSHYLALYLPLKPLPPCGNVTLCQHGKCIPIEELFPCYRKWTSLERMEGSYFDRKLLNIHFRA